MLKKIWKSLLVVSASFFVCTADAVTHKPWTFLVYMAAANDLHASALLDVQKMMQVGSNENVNIIVYLTVQEDNQPKTTVKLYVEKGLVTHIGDTMVRDSGDVATLQEALQWACRDYPSDHIAVVLWSHGSGSLNRSQCKGVCYDFDTENYLTDCNCLQAFSWVRDSVRDGQKFDIVAFDAPLLGSIEIAYALSACADYMVASEATIPGDGYEYAYIVNQLAVEICDPLSCAQLMVNASQREYAETPEYILSAIDLNALQPLVDNCNAIAQILTTQMTGKKKAEAKLAFKKCIDSKCCPSFDQGIYIDLYQFYKNVLKHSDGLKLSKSVINQFKQLLNDGIGLFSDIIKAHVASPHYAQTGGLSIYFSRHFLDPSYYGLYWTQHNPNWLNFLEAFLDNLI
jgi:Clostripain family